MEQDLTEKIVVHDSPLTTLDTLKIRGTVKAPNTQRQSFDQTRQRMKDKSSKVFSFKRTNNVFFTIKRIR